MNIVVVVSDTLRACELGCYGGTTRTPNMDAFARGGVRFTRAFPESLPTIPVRRALHTGRRAYPFRDWRPVRWDIVYLPGWQAMRNEEDTVAEALARAGFQTGFVTDTLPYFAPGFNFTRGFWQWEFVRGQQQDRWKSPFAVPREVLERYADPGTWDRTKHTHSIVQMHLANTLHVKREEDTNTARVFTRAMDFLEENVGGQPFYLLVDCFDPHEPWEAPEPYYRLYGDPEYRGRRILHCAYAPAREAGYGDDEVRYVHAQYRGLTTLVDAWFGRLVGRLDALGLSGTTAIFLVSDHGTNFCDNPRGVIGKPANAMYPGVVRLPLIARVPGAPGGVVRDEIVSNLDLVATVCDLAGTAPAEGCDGRSLLPLITGAGSWRRREYATCRYANSLCYVDDGTWALGDIDGTAQEVFDLSADPACMDDISARDGGRRWRTAWERLLADAGGDFPDYRNVDFTDAIGERPVR